MGRPTELKIRVPRSVNFEYEDYKEFEDIVGKDNVSRELRAMMRNFLDIQKKGEAQLDPLNQVRSTKTYSSINNNESLNICISNNRDLRDFIENVEDIETLAKVENNSRTLKNLAHNKKIDLCALNRMTKLGK